MKCRQLSPEEIAAANAVAAHPLGAAPCSAPLSGEWRHAEGFLICGTLRIARADFDTDPSEGFRVRMFDWICDTLNAAQNDEAQGRRV
jgi:hypothetical protein